MYAYMCISSFVLSCHFFLACKGWTFPMDATSPLLTILSHLPSQSPLPHCPLHPLPPCHAQSP